MTNEYIFKKNFATVGIIYADVATIIFQSDDVSQGIQTSRDPTQFACLCA